MTVLIIEDDEKISAFLRRGLEAEGFKVELSRNGAIGLADATAGSYKLVILDLTLPELHGFDVCREIRARGIATPVLMLTARGSLDDKVAGLNAGADDYLTKPFAFEELLARVNALVRRGAGHLTKSPRVAVADLVFDRETMQLRRGERSIDLTSKEMAILDLLLTRPGAVFSRATILSEVWGEPSDAANNFVEVYMGRLRRKIDAEGEPPLIETLRGRGYRIRAEERAP